MDTVAILSEQYTIAGFPVIPDKFLDGLASAIQLLAETVDTQKALGSARDEFHIDRNIVSEQLHFTFHTDGSAACCHGYAARCSMVCGILNPAIAMRTGVSAAL